jgi:hypothetical protein
VHGGKVLGLLNLMPNAFKCSFAYLTAALLRNQPSGGVDSGADLLH